MMVKVQKSLFEYRRTPEVGFQCTIDLSRLFPAPKDRKEFEDRFEEFQTVAEMHEIRLFGIPPTRLSEPAGKTLRKFLGKISRHSVMAASRNAT